MTSHLTPSLSVAPVALGRKDETKAVSAFRTISEVANNLEVPQHVLRFWESKFQQIRPMKRGGGRRYYRPEDVALLNSIKDLLYNRGLTIRGVQKLLRENSSRSSLSSPATAQDAAESLALQVPMQLPAAGGKGLSADKRRAVEGVLSELKSLRELLRQTGI